MKENIVGFEISMHDAVLIEHLECLKQLPKDFECTLLRQFSLLLKERLKGLAVAVVVDEVEVVGSLQHLHVANDEGAWLDLRKDVDFVDGAFLQLGVLLELLHRNDLDCELLLGYQVRCLIDLAIHALPDDFLQRVVFNDLSHPPNNTNLLL